MYVRHLITNIHVWTYSFSTTLIKNIFLFIVNVCTYYLKIYRFIFVHSLHIYWPVLLGQYIYYACTILVQYLLLHDIFRNHRIWYFQLWSFLLKVSINSLDILWFYKISGFIYIFLYILDKNTLFIIYINYLIIYINICIYKYMHM